MADDLEAIREMTRSFLGKDADVSYITQELLTEYDNVKPSAVPMSIDTEGNSFVQYSESRFVWKAICGDQPQEAYVRPRVTYKAAVRTVKLCTGFRSRKRRCVLIGDC